VTDPFTVDPDDNGGGSYRIDATLTWEPSNPEGTEPVRAEFELRDADGTTVAESDGAAGTTRTGDQATRRLVVDDSTIEGSLNQGEQYKFFAYSNRGIADWEIDWEVQEVTDEAANPDSTGEGYVDSTLTFNVDTPEAQAARLEVVLQNFDGDKVASAGPGILTTPSSNEITLGTRVEPGLYRFRVTTWRSVSSWDIESSVETVIDEEAYEGADDQSEYATTEYDFDEFTGDVLPNNDDEITVDTPKLVGFYNEEGRYQGAPKPDDPNGHGSHVAGIMTGTGQASSIDYGNTTTEEPRAVLAPTDFVEYDVDVGASETVFASALGEGVVVEIVYDGEVIYQAPLREDSVIADAPAVHDSGTDSYTVRVRPFETDDGTPTAARLNEIAYGGYVTTYTDDVLGERVDNNEDSMHAGMAPNASLVSLEALSAPTEDLTEISGDLAGTLNVRAINMSWGYLGGAPLGAEGEEFTGPLDGIRTAANNGILTVAAAGNSWTPANGNGAPAVAAEAISVVATGPLDGITSYSSGGIGGRDQDDGSFNGKPDVMAPGGDIEPDSVGAIATGVAGAPYPVPSRVELVRAALAPGSGFDDDSEAEDNPRDHVSVGGTSMASPYTCGTAGLVAQAMEEDAPDSIALSEPGNAEIEDTLRLKQAVLATASETAFTAAPYHAAKNVPSAPQYTHGDRDPYEGYGRVNPDAAVDAVSRNLLGTDPQLGDETYEVGFEEAVGTNIPVDSRAVAGYVDVPGGDLEVSVDFTGYSGGNRGLAKGDAHLDLFVYDAEAPAENGEPNIVTSVRGVDGTGSVSVSVDRGSRDDLNRDTYYVVAKIVNIPGVVNGYDVQANFDLGVTFTPADEFPPKKVNLNVSGSRSDDGDAFTGGQTNQVKVTVEDFNEELTDKVTVSDEVPGSWTVDENYGDVESVEGNTVNFEGAADAEGATTFTYFAEAPDGATETGTYTFGPATATAVNPTDYSSNPDKTRGSTEENFGGTDTVTVVGQSSETGN
jgi:subtilisin family serine protease